MTIILIILIIAAVIYVIIRRPFNGTVKDVVDDSDPLPTNRGRGKTKEHSIDGQPDEENEANARD